MNDLIKKIKQQTNLTVNNWRKMHGLPMLRGKNKKLKRSLFNLQPIQNPTLCVEVENVETVEKICENIKKFYENKNK